MKTVCKPNQCAGCKACIDICKKNAISIMDSLSHLNAAIDEKNALIAAHAKKFVPIIILLKKRSRRNGIKGGLKLLDKLLHRVEQRQDSCVHLLKMVVM